MLALVAKLIALIATSDHVKRWANTFTAETIENTIKNSSNNTTIILLNIFIFLPPLL
jgi:hypothetical protein